MKSSFERLAVGYPPAAEAASPQIAEEHGDLGGEKAMGR